MSAYEQATHSMTRGSPLPVFPALEIDDQENLDSPWESLDIPCVSDQKRNPSRASIQNGRTKLIANRASLRSRLNDSVQDSGQQFHTQSIGEYLLPNDETEQERLDIQHHLMLLTLDGKLNIAPIENVEGGLHNVLDIATGIGNWAIAFANTYPSVNVVGIDISRMQPESIPSNCHFVIKDAEEEWKFSDPFDYIHGCALVSCFRSHKTVFEHAFKALRSGGYFELQDCILPLRFFDSSGKGTPLEIWSQCLVAGAAALGKDFKEVEKYRALLEEVGFVDVVEVQAQLPVGTWAAGKKMKPLGWWMRKDLLHGVEGMSMAVQTRGLGLSPEEVESHLTDVKKDLLSNKVHAYFQISLVYGRKP